MLNNKSNDNKELVKRLKKEKAKRDQDKELLEELLQTYKSKLTIGRKIALGLTLGFIILAAILVPVLYFHVFNPNVEVKMEIEGANHQTLSIEVKKGKEISELKPIEITGYVFDGFYKDEACWIKFLDTEIITKDTTIYCKYIPTTYQIEFPTSMIGYNIISSQTEVEHLQSYTFDVELEDAYSNSEFQVMVNGSYKSANAQGKYIINNVTQNLKIEVYGVVKNVYNITLPENIVGYEFVSTNLTSLEHGSNYEFGINLKTEYSESNLKVKANGEELEKVDGKYKVFNISSNVIITIEGVEINTYSITLPTSELYTITSTQTSVEHGNYYTFAVELSEDYSNSDVVVKVNKAEVTPNSRNGNKIEYSVIATEDLLIEVLNLIKN